MARDDQKSPEAHLATKQRMGGGRTEITSLTVQVKDWPTPTAGDSKASGNSQEALDRGFTGTLTDASRAWPTPQAHDAKGAGHDNTNLHNAALAGRPDETTPTDGPDGPPKVDLNPRFVEALMGVPPGWLTPSTSVETDWFQWWLHAHSLNSPTEPASTCGVA